MKLNKIKRDFIDEMLDCDIETHWSNQAVSVPDLSKFEFKFIADEILKNNKDLKRSDIFIYYHRVVGEYCVIIKGKWSGYIEIWDEANMSFEDYYGTDNLNYFEILNPRKNSRRS